MGFYYWFCGSQVNAECLIVSWFARKKLASKDIELVPDHGSDVG